MRCCVMLAMIACFAHYVFGQEPVVGSAEPEKLFKSSDRKLNANKQVVLHIVRDLLEAGHWVEAPKYISKRYFQHNPNVPSGLDPVMKFFGGMPSHDIPGPHNWKTKVASVTAEGDLVVVATVRELKTKAGQAYTTTWFDMWRIKDGKADEHWDGATMFGQ